MVDHVFKIQEILSRWDKKKKKKHHKYLLENTGKARGFSTNTVVINWSTIIHWVTHLKGIFKAPPSTRKNVTWLLILPEFPTIPANLSNTISFVALLCPCQQNAIFFDIFQTVLSEVWLHCIWKSAACYQVNHKCVNTQASKYGCIFVPPQCTWKQSGAIAWMSCLF